MAAGKLDREVGIQYCGTEELYESVLEDFYKLIETKANKIEELLANNDIRNYTIEVHALKSTARLIGATEMSELAFKMEQAGNDNDIETINENTPVLMEMYRSYLETLSYFDKNDSAKEKVSKNKIKGELFRMNVFAKSFDMDAVDDSMKKVNSYEMPSEEIKDKVVDLDNMVRDVAFEDVIKTTVEIGKMLG